MFKYSKAHKRIKEAGVIKFYYDRKVLASDVGTIGDFVSSAKRSVVYIGCWLSSSIKQDLIKIVQEKAKEGVLFTFCLHAPRTQAIEEYASFFGSDELSINTQIEESLLTLWDAKNSLPKNVSENIKIYWHSEMITTSLWLIDNESADQKLQLDFKLVKTKCRWFSFGIEAIPSSSDFFNNVKESYLSVVEEKNEIDEFYIDDINGIHQNIYELRKLIHEKYPFDPTKPYVFISYSHKNNVVVLNDLLQLKQKINCWVDFEMLDGGRNRTQNDWTKKIRPAMESDRCLGVISYVSQKGFGSDGFIQECDWIKDFRPNLYCFLIDFPKSINANEMLTLIKEYNHIGESQREKQIRDEALTYITQATSAGKESYYHVRNGPKHLETPDFTNWLTNIRNMNQ